LPSKKAADLAPSLIGTKGKVGRPAAATEANQPLNFKMPADFKRRFRMAAAERGMKLNELLAEAFEAWQREHRS
jgi:hypothetical protein